ncbi:2-hydroxy-6-oxo-2,4-heptadienoate hydrolase [Candidatus Entotheonellaceae bacterium PAL068K]
MEEKTVTVRDGMFETNLRTDGNGDPLLYLHSAGGLRGWDPFLAELAQHFTVYAPSHPGFETSTGLEHIDDIIDLTVYYNDLLDALGLVSTHVVGHSLGAMVAAELAALSPHRVRKLVLANAVGLWLDKQPVADFFAMTPDQLATALWHDPNSDPAKAMLAVPEDEQAQLEAYLIRSQHLATAGKFLWPLPDKGLKKRIHRIQAPTLILWGQSDGLAPVAYAHEFQKRIAGSQVSIMPRCGHLPMYEDQDGFVRLVSGFLNG